MNLLTILNIFKKYFKVLGKNEEDPDAKQNVGQKCIISDPDPDPFDKITSVPCGSRTLKEQRQPIQIQMPLF